MGFETILTPDDLKKGDLVKPGWYPAEITHYDEAIVKGSEQKPSDGSTQCIFKFKIIDGEFKGVSPQVQFNEKALGFGKELWKALEFPFDPQKGYKLGTALFEKTVGSKLEIYIKRGKGQTGKEFNEVAGYRKMGSVKTA